MEKLLQQIRDNLRLSNWACFPENSIEYLYNLEGNLYLTTYKRNGTAQFHIEKFYDEWGNLIEERYKAHIDGTDNL